MTHMIKLECRDCDSPPVEFASDAPYDTPSIEEMQEHVDSQFVARCGHCFSGNWEVLEVNPLKKFNGRAP